MTQLTQRQQAMLIWPVLSFAARMQRVLTYGDIQGLTGIARIGQGQALGLIHDYCKRKHYPLLNTIAVLGQGEGVGFPSHGEPEQMSQVQYLEERARVFAFDWTSTAVDKPRPEDFDESHPATA
ncbi:MAG TPA: hypothetical protein VGT03_03730 [Candidatus Acidoferrales bacterium]|nr:hypothetical protein [Candidatus Acidoferrales bacterium]